MRRSVVATTKQEDGGKACRDRRHVTPLCPCDSFELRERGLVDAEIGCLSRPPATSSTDISLREGKKSHLSMPGGEVRESEPKRLSGSREHHTPGVPDLQSALSTCVRSHLSGHGRAPAPRESGESAGEGIAHTLVIRSDPREPRFPPTELGRRELKKPGWSHLPIRMALGRASCHVTSCRGRGLDRTPGGLAPHHTSFRTGERKGRAARQHQGHRCFVCPDV